MNTDVKWLRQEITKLLLSTERDGMDRMISELDTIGYFTSPASTKFHSCFKGGLAHHSLGVYILLSRRNKELKLSIAEDSIIITTLLHDVCKCGAYKGDSKPYTWNRAQPKGHAMLSLIRIAPFLELNELEEKMIKYHMGIYGTIEFEAKGEYPLRGGGLMNAWYHHPICKIMYFCDEFETFAARAKETE